MIKNYFKTAWRNLMKNKTFSLINIIGLAVSMSVCLLIILIIADQKSYDRFHTKRDRIYRIATEGKNGNQMATASSALPLGQELKEGYTGIEATASLVKSIGGDVFYNDKVASGGGYFADGNLFKIMDFKLAQGDAATALNNPFSIVLTEELATQLFYNENPVGKIVQFNDKGINPSGPETGNKETAYGQFTVTGVLKPNPGKTSLPFKLLASLSTVPALTRDSKLSYPPGDWNNVWTSYTYVLMEKGKTEADLQNILNKVADKQYADPTGGQFVLKAEALEALTPGRAIGNITHISLPRPVLIFLCILCLIIMLSACLNYTNLSVARSLTRAKEVGIRKVAGASRKQIFGQFIAESVLVSFIALIFSFLLLLLLQPLFTGLWLNRFFNISFSYNVKLYTVFLGFSLLVGFIAGFLPSAYISVLNPVQVFKSVNSIRIFKGLTIRKVLLVVQFSVSLIFIISASLIYSQTNHVFNFDYGFNKDNVINIKLYKTENYQRFAQTISTNKNIIVVSACGYPPASGIQNGTMVFKFDGIKDSLQANYIDIDGKCLDVWDLKLVAGKNLPAIPADSSGQYMLVNEKMVAAFRYPSAAAAVGQHLQVDGGNVEIAGVVKDFQFLEVNRGVEPLMLRNRQREFGYVTVRIAANNIPETVGFLQAAWKKVNPNTKFEYEFFDSQVHMMHLMLKDAASIIGFLAFLAVLVSCLGLLGMAVYTAETKRKEVGIRKVLGSGVYQIITLLSKGFMILLAIAVLIATPIAYLLNSVWLQFFASRVSIGPAILLLSISMLAFISLSIVLSQAWRVSRINPVKSLRTE
ncbi:MAG: ABC transporter permease [Chitinophagaceae bacterium]|nr:ABC transporter permease [Chitinophagaceae bacterium]